MGATWLVGVAINLVGSVLINLGTNVMKLGHNKRAALNRTESTSSATPVRKIREWQIGVALFSVGNVANFVSFGYAAQSLLSAIGCIQFVSNVFFASFVLKEQVSFQVIVAISCIVGGCIILVSFGSHTSKVYTYRDLLKLYGQPAYICYMCLGGTAVVLAYTGYWKGQKAVDAQGADAARLWVAVLPILYCIFSAIIGTQSVLFSKTLAVLLRATFSGDNQLGKWFTWLVLPAFLFSAAFWVTRLNKGLQMFPAMIVVPTLQICWTLFSILSGMLYFQEYQDMRALHAAMFALGVSVLFVGVFLLTKASAPKGQGSTGNEHLTVELNKAKIAYVHHEDDEVDLPNAEAAETTGLIGTKVAKENLAQSEKLQGETPGQRNPLRGAANLNSDRHAELNLDADADPNMHHGHEEDEQLLVGNSINSTSNDAKTNQGPKQTSKHSFSFSKAFSGSLGLQQLWSGNDNESNGSGSSRGRGGGVPGGQGAQVLPDFAGADDEGAAETTSMQRQHQRRRFKYSVSSLSKNVAKDFNLDETAAARLTLGLGDSAMPGVSLFAMPMIDVASLAPVTVGRQGRRYRAESDGNQGNATVHSQDGPLLSKPDNPSSAVYDSDGQLGASQAAAIKKLHKEQQMVGLDPPRGINPLANAIDVRSASISAPSILGRQVSMDRLLTSVKQNFGSIHANIRDLTSNIQAGSAGRNYARMGSKDGVDNGAASAGHSRRDSMQ